MIELIKKLKEEGVKLTVATSTDRDVFMPCLERLGLDKYLTVFYMYGGRSQQGRAGNI